MCIFTGVADGVGGWSSAGIDPSHFSKALMTCCSSLVTKEMVHLNSAKEILSSGFSELLSLYSKTYGKLIMLHALLYQCSVANPISPLFIATVKVQLITLKVDCYFKDNNIES